MGQSKVTPVEIETSVTTFHTGYAEWPSPAEVSAVDVWG